MRWHAALALATAGPWLVAAPAPARALPSAEAIATRIATEPLTFAVALLAAVVFAWALVETRRLARMLRQARKRASDLETELNEAEIALTAEPHLLFIWRGRDEDPERIAGDMRGTCTVPDTPDRLADFSGWLEPESVNTLKAALAELRARGTAFNFGIKTAQGDLLEADGRAAGGLATLRLRPLAGERLELTELAHDRRKLARQVDRLAAILDSAPMPVWLRLGDGRLAWANRAYVTALEAASLDEVLSSGAELFASVEGSGGDAPRRQRDHTVIGGTKKALDIVEVPVEDGCAGFAIDVSELEDSEKELKRHIRAHASTLDKLATAIAIFGPDQRLRFHNAAYADLWQLDPEWLDTHPYDSEILDRLREQRCLPEQANYRDWKARLLEAYNTLDTREDWWHLPDGRTLRVVAEQHPFGGVTYLYENITEMIRLESSYNELIGVQRETLDNLHEGIALFGTDGRLKLFNPAYATLWSLDGEFLADDPHIDDIIAMCREHLPDDALWDELKYAITSLDDGRRALKARLERPDGSVLDFALAPLPDGNTLITYTDVTDSSRMERALRERAEALEAADKLKTDFLSNVSYELRTPLTNIIGFADSLMLGLAGDLEPKQREYMQDILTSSADLLSVIDAILDLTTIDAGAMELNLEPVDVAGLLTEAAREMHDPVHKRAITLQVEIPEDAGMVKADRRRLGQVLHHLLSNAVGFSPDRSTVHMGARREGDELVMWVSDTGKGMDQDFQKAAFERFRARPAASGHRGPGLGLALVKSFVELHDGTVALRSKVDQGTTVICRLPADGPDSAGQAARINPAPVSRPVADEARMPTTATG
ncbi:PAS-domain containing protein [Kaustia mangrovi]|uniref:histidine kinase n=1 Tax=Kaustia mangrovi TaxID=2593653 RepID=A0A7S8HBJ5_9HYPH|nr:PAS domain-containing sensor histidine kinase [Kaustia mangrovi]QPC42556.1 PAS-domain containing protein [Kaustia mangrovi]